MYLSIYRAIKLVSTERALPNAPSFNLLAVVSATIALTFASTSSLAADTPVAPKACEALKGQTIGGASIADSAMVSPPAGRGDPFCKVTGHIHETLGFEIHLPVQWNKKLLYAGGGGFNGVINTRALSFSGNNNYVLVASDGGRRFGSGLRWQLKHQLMLSGSCWKTTSIWSTRPWHETQPTPRETCALWLKYT